MANIVSYYIEPEKKKFKVSDSRGGLILSSDLTEILEFFLKGDADFRIVWSLFDIITILEKLLPGEAYNKIIETDKVTWNDFRLFSSSGRLFAINHKWREHLHDNFYSEQKKEVEIYHLAQFFPDDRVSSPVEVEAKGQELIDTLAGMGLHPTRLTSAVSIYDECILSKIDLPTVYNMPENSLDCAEYAHRLVCNKYSGNREWGAVYQVGHFENCFDVDCNGGYPSMMRDLPDTRDMKVWYSKKYTPCDFAILKGKVFIDSDFSPIIDNLGIAYKGVKEDYFTSWQWGMINKYHLGHCEMKDGWFMKFTTDNKPFKELMEDLYNARGESGLDRLIPKLISTGISGRLAQEYENRYGDYFNPILSCMTTGGMSLKLGKMIIENHLENNIISVSVDGCLIDKKPDVSPGVGLGEWRISEPLNALVVSCGFQWAADKHPGAYYYDDMIKAARLSPSSSLINGIVLNNDLETNRDFKEYPKNNRELLERKFRSTAKISKE